MQKVRLVVQPCTIQVLESRQLLAAVAIDMSFGVEGRVVSDFGGSDSLRDATLQADGRLLLLTSASNGNSSNSFLVRYNSDGTRDQSVAPGGQVSLPQQGNGTTYSLLHILSDGKLLLAGTSYFFGGIQPHANLLFVRLNPDFSPDSSFGPGGVVNSEFTIPASSFPISFAVLPDGKILAGGESNYDGTPAAVWRFNSDGALDQTFGSGGAATYFYGYSVPHQAISSLLVNADGSFFGVTPLGEAKFSANGAFDITFGSQGYLPQGITLKRVLSDGRLLGLQRLATTPDTTGGFLSDILVSRWNSNGAPDVSFGNNGAARIDFARYDQPHDLNLDSSGRIILGAGTFNDSITTPQRFALARLLPDGQLDSLFGSGGKYIDQFGTAAHIVLPTSDNKIIAAGFGNDRSTEDPALWPNGNITITRYVPDVPINISIQSSGPVNEGSMFPVNGGGSSYPNGQIVRYEWDSGFDGYTFTTEAEGMAASIRAADDPVTQVALRVTTSDGLRFQAVGGVATLNVPPVASAGPDQFVLTNAPMGVQVRSDDVVPETGMLTVDWGDGSPLSGTVFDTPTNPMARTYFHTYQQSGTYTVTLTADDGDGGISTDTAIIRAFDITANVFQDTNGDGINNVGESGFPGVTVWVDLNDNGAQDPDEPSDLTNSDGWVFFDVPAGNYKLRLQTPDGWQRSFSDPNFHGDYWPAPVPLRLDNRPFMGLHETDLQPPQLTSFVFRRDLNPNRIEVTFSEPMRLFSSSLVVTPSPGGTNIALDLSYDTATTTAIYTSQYPSILPDGNYIASFNVNNTKDQAGNPLAGQTQWSFFVLKGDLNLDRQVSIADFITLSSNFGKTNAIYADGDINYDGEVTIADFIDLAANFNKTIPPPAQAAPAEAAAAVEINSTASSPASDLLVQDHEVKALAAKPVLLPRHMKHHRKPRIILRH